jgi:hypothetical protein
LQSRRRWPRDPQVLTNADSETDRPAFTSSNTPRGFSGGSFSSMIERFW